MSLASGARVGPYEVLAPLGAGGMGEVYRARDTKLGRDVALKVLPDLFASDPERLARFEREAKTLASLNHPHIAQIYGFEHGPPEAGPHIRALVMELVEGEDLAQRIARGPIPIDQALPMAKQIADALGAAHEQGIVHRDLKPANIKLREDGTLKVLDFGLAKLIAPSTPGDGGRDFSPAGAREGATNSPTITSPAMTMRGMILGTAAYMAPEQAKGKAVDKRADIWAFGCVLYEMLTGRRAFDGDDVSDTLAVVLRGEPEWTRVPAPALRLLQKCLAKDPRHRLHDIGDAFDLIDAPSVTTSVRSTSRPWLAWGVAAVLLATTIALAIVHFRETPPRLETVRFQIPPPLKSTFDIYIQLSPDGRRLAFTARDETGAVHLWVRELDTFEARRLPGTEDAGAPFWSPDGRFIAFGTQRTLKKIDVAGGSPQTVAESPDTVGSGAWGADDVIVFGARGAGTLKRVAAAGGVPTPLTTIDDARGETFHSFPFFLPDQRHFAYLRSSSNADDHGLYVGSLDVTPDQQDKTRVVGATMGPVHVSHAANAGRLLYVLDGTLMAQPFDVATRRVTGAPVPVAEGLGSTGSFAYFTASLTDVLAYRTGVGTALNVEQLAWFDRKGQRIATVGEPRGYVAPSLALAPDAATAVVGISSTRAVPDLWLLEFARGVVTRFTFHNAPDTDPVWSPDGARIVFRSARGQASDLYIKETSGATDETVLVSTAMAKTPTDWSRDGRLLLYQSASPTTGWDIWLLPLESKQPVPLLQTQFNETGARFSPDGRWIAYVSNESGRQEIYLRPFDMIANGPPRVGAKWRVSTDGGLAPRWRRDGKELYFRAPAGMLMAVDVAAAGSTAPTAIPQVLFTMGVNTTGFDVAPDGQRFLISTPVARTASDPVSVVLNWSAGQAR